ncbi:hypothetical protein CANINC_002334 [Pichia inconspicua]|uniref:NUA/TPR/MLP1-2-like domain-containing protein n=1 Tax=Pichia inconspicua TaxID=52247 RepID=A0A4T0X386_9ASCO|nr:hypothetical protein CANINC_002334 [[Candida] inconspicua]
MDHQILKDAVEAQTVSPEESNPNDLGNGTNEEHIQLDEPGSSSECNADQQMLNVEHVIDENIVCQLEPESDCSHVPNDELKDTNHGDEMNNDSKGTEYNENYQKLVPVESSFIEPMQEETHSEENTPTTANRSLMKNDSDAYQNVPIESISPDEDFETVAAFYSLSNDILKTNNDLFISLYTKYKDFENLKSNNQLLQINYEQLKHTQNRNVEHFKHELSIAKSEIDRVEASKLLIAKENEALKTTAQNMERAKDQSNRIAEQLKLRINELESSKTYISELLDRKQSQLDELNQEIKTLLEENKKIKKSLSDNESSEEILNSKILKYKLEASKLENELQLLSTSRDWYENELKTRTTEFDEYRSQTNKRLSQALNELNSTKQEAEIVKSSLEKYRSKVEKLTSENQEYQFKIKELSDKLSSQESQYENLLKRKEEYIQVLEKSVKDKTQRIESLDRVYKETYEKVKLDEEAYKRKFEELESEVIRREAKIRELESTINSLTELPMTNEDGIQISSYATKTLNEIDSELSLTDLLEELNSLKRAILIERRAKVKAETELSNILKELQRKMPLMSSLEEKLEAAQEEEHMLNHMVTVLNSEKKNISKTCDLLKKKVTESELQIKSLAKYKIDLQKQLVVLLSEMQFKQCGESPLTLEEKDYIGNIVGKFGEIKDMDENDTEQLISDRLTTFKDITELIKQNENLMVVSRKLASELESKENNSNNLLGDAETDTIQKAKNAIVKLQEKVKNLETQLKATQNSRDILQNLLDSGAVGDKNDKSATEERVNVLIAELKSKKEELATLRKSYDEHMFELNTKLRNSDSERTETELRLAKEVSLNTLNQEKINSLISKIEFMKQESAQLRSMIEKNNKNSALLENKVQEVNDELIKKNSTVVNLEIQVKTMIAEKNVWKSVEEQLRNEVTRLYNEKAESNERYIRLQTLDGERQAHFAEALKRFSNTQDALQKEIEILREKLEKSNNEISSILHSKNVDSKIYHKRIDLLTDELSLNKELIAAKEKLVNELQGELAALKRKQVSIDERKQNVLTSIGSSSESDNISVLKEELKNALEDLDVALKESTQYKELSSAAEKQLRILNENYTQYKAITEDKISSLTSKLNDAVSKVEELQHEKEKMDSDYTHLQQSSEIEKQEYTSKIDELNVAIGTFESIKSDYESKLQLAKDELKEKEKNIQELRDLIGDKDNQILAFETIAEASKKEVNDFKNKILHDEEIIAQKDALVDQIQTQNKDTIIKLEQDLRNDRIRISELETQNRTLLNQLEESPLSYGESDDMKNLIAYLNREKDSLSQQLSYVQGEEAILRQNLISREKEVAELKSELAVVKEKSATIDKYVESMANMKSEVEELRVYKENNASLRNQIELYESRISDMERQLNQVSSDYSSANSNIGELQNRIEEATSENAELREQVKKLNEQLRDVAGSAASLDDLEAKNKLVTELEAKLEEKNNLVARMKAEFIDKLRKKSAEKNQVEEDLKKLTVKIEHLENQSIASPGADNNDAVNSLQTEINSLKEQIRQKTAENATISQTSAEQLSKVTAQMASLKNELETLKSSVGEVQVKDVSEIEKKYIEEKEELLKELQELKNNTSSVNDKELEQLKESLKAEYKAAADAEIQNQKMKYQARLNGIIEKRVQAYKDQVKEYEITVAELREKLKTVGDSSKVEELLKKFEIEKEDLKKQTRSAVEKEKEFKEKLLQGKINRLEDEVKKLKESSNQLIPMKMPMQMGVMPTGNFGNLPNMPNMPNMTNMANVTSMGNMNYNFEQTRDAQAFVPTSRQSQTTHTLNAKSIPTKPAKRVAIEENKEAEKRTKTE